MDQLMNFGKQAYSEYQASQQGHQGQGDGQFGVLGSAALNSNDNNRPAQSGMPFDPSQAVQHASNASNNSGDSNLFSQAMSFLNNNFDGKHDDLDEDEAVKAHEQAYGNSNSSQLGSKPLGAAAAMQALKTFTSGSSNQSMASSSGGNFQTKLIAQAMAEAAKLFDKNGGAADGNKQDVVQSAASTMMKLMLKNKVSGTMGAGSEGGSSAGGFGSQAGGLSQMFSMAQQFMK
ncbi:hypothetical protein OIO90_002406 [Microbotryomycetes sp. JL221]|nr:hypothetical protein OIO90_002406 [Microbotryomycetes sp. JL221]